MGMRRGAVKTPGGKLVAVTVQTDQSGLPVACRLDGDFFIDGDGAPLLLDDLERT
ncbi:MAG: lipoate--protein ligase family protein, partial [Bifidobacterium sp.]|nr:lipoate--protein ligase family protein [Bifidobacterium sp.]